MYLSNSTLSVCFLMQNTFSVFMVWESHMLNPPYWLGFLGIWSHGLKRFHHQTHHHFGCPNPHLGVPNSSLRIVWFVISDWDLPGTLNNPCFNAWLSIGWSTKSLHGKWVFHQTSTLNMVVWGSWCQWGYNTSQSSNSSLGYFSCDRFFFGQFGRWQSLVTSMFGIPAKEADMFEASTSSFDNHAPVENRSGNSKMSSTFARRILGMYMYLHWEVFHRTQEYGRKVV